MDDQKEKVEAQLCEFVDGTLTGPERQVIEDYLRNNPSLREMVDELITHRRAVAALPREKAPAFMGEDVYGQLEREALLARGLDQEVAPTLRIHRWPQLLSAAAIILLAVGLGILVYFVLPPKHPALPVAQTASTLPEQAELRQNDQLAMLEANDEEVQPEDSVTVAALAKQSTPMPGETDRTALVSVEALADVQDVRATVAPPTEQTVVLTVTANDVGATNQELIQFLSANGITWTAPSSQRVPRSTFFTATDSTPAAGAESRSRAMSVKGIGAGGKEMRGPSGIAPDPAAAGVSVAAPPLRQQTDGVVPIDSARPSRQRFERDANEQAELVEASPGSRGGAANKPIEMHSRLSVRPSGVSGRVIVARNVSAHQLHELARSLSRPDRNRVTELQAQAGTAGSVPTRLLGAPVTVMVESPLEAPAEVPAEAFSLSTQQESRRSVATTSDITAAGPTPTLRLDADFQFTRAAAPADKQLSLIPQQVSSLLNFGSYGFSLSDGREDGARLSGRVNLVPNVGLFGPLGALGQIGLGFEERMNCVIILKDVAPASAGPEIEMELGEQ